MAWALVLAQVPEAPRPQKPLQGGETHAHIKLTGVGMPYSGKGLCGHLGKTELLK